MRRRGFAVELVTAVVALILGAASAASAETLRVLPLGFEGRAVADDGITAVGRYRLVPGDPPGTDHGAALWTPAGGTEVLVPNDQPEEPSGAAQMRFEHISADGAKVTLNGAYFDPDYGYFTLARAFDIATGQTSSGSNEARMYGISADGQTTIHRDMGGSGSEWYSRVRNAAGEVTVPHPHPDYVDLPYCPEGCGMYAQDISGDGGTVVGNTTMGDAFLWTPSGGSQLIVTGDASANAISTNGAWVAGVQAPSGENASLFIHDVGGGTTFIDDASASASVVGITDDASLMALQTAEGPQIWREGVGLTHLLSILEDEMDLDMTGWSLADVRDLSANGRYLLGTGHSPAGEYRTWIVDLAELPEPSTRLLLLVGLVFALRVRRLQ